MRPEPARARICNSKQGIGNHRGVLIETNGWDTIIDSYLREMKVVGITILRMGNEDPIPVSMACDLSSYGFFQRQVRGAFEKFIILLMHD